MVAADPRNQQARTHKEITGPGRIYTRGMSLTTVPLTRGEYDVLVAAGALDGEPVELLAGRKVRMSPESPLHTAVIEWLADRLRPAASPAGLAVRVAHPVALSDLDEPEPDLAVVTAREDRYASSHPGPEDVHLLVEVAGASRRKDLEDKARRYAAAGVGEYWVVDLESERTVIHREPDLDGAYGTVRAVAFGEPVSPLCLPDLALATGIPG